MFRKNFQDFNNLFLILEGLPILLWHKTQACFYRSEALPFVGRIYLQRKLLLTIENISKVGVILNISSKAIVFIRNSS